MSRLKSLLLAGAGIALATGFSDPAHAVLKLSADLNGTNFTCVDNAACDTNNTIGILNVGDVNQGGVEVFGTFQTQAIATGIGTNNRLDTSSFTVVNHNATTVPVTVAVSGINFQGPVTTFTASGNSNFTEAVGSNIQLQYYGDTGNNQGADNPNDTPGTKLVDTGVNNVTDPSQSFNVNQSGPFVDNNVFSLTLWGTLNLTPNGRLTNRTQSLVATQVAIPEPDSLVLLGTMGAGLFGVGFIARRRRNDVGGSYCA